MKLLKNEEKQWRRRQREKGKVSSNDICSIFEMIWVIKKSSCEVSSGQRLDLKDFYYTGERFSGIVNQYIDYYW